MSLQHASSGVPVALPPPSPAGRRASVPRGRRADGGSGAEGAAGEIGLETAGRREARSMHGKCPLIRPNHAGMSPRRGAEVGGAGPGVGSRGMVQGRVQGGLKVGPGAGSRSRVQRQGPGGLKVGLKAGSRSSVQSRVQEVGPGAGSRGRVQGWVQGQGPG